MQFNHANTWKREKEKAEKLEKIDRAKV